MIRWFLLIPLALLIAVGASSLFLFFATLVDPVMATLTGNTLVVGFWSFVDEVFSVQDPGPVVAEAFVTVGRIAFTFLIFPPLLVAVVSEATRMRSIVWYVGATGALTAAIPWILRGSARVVAPGELHVTAVLGLTGAVAGLVYWAIAGRDAGRSPIREDVRPGAPGVKPDLPPGD